MATKLKIKVGDTVRVIAGASKGQEGKIQKVLVEKNKAIALGGAKFVCRSSSNLARSVYRARSEN
mgnify:CR=1 FL=1